jgi:hypothetical protein
MWLARRGAGARRPGTIAEAAHSLRVVAARLGGRAPTAGEYRRERAALLAADCARHRHGGRLELLSEDQIRAAAGGGWPQALTLAGLGAPGATPTSERGGRRRAVPVDEALERCLDYHGALPTGTALEAFAAAHGFALKRRDAPLGADRRACPRAT